MPILNISAYKFISLDANYLLQLQSEFKQKAQLLGIKGTILLSPEGVNLNLSGFPENIQAFQLFLSEFPEFLDLVYKESYSQQLIFKRLFVKIKKEIITMGAPDIHPEEYTAPHLSPEEFKQWYEQAKDMVVLDTRNVYEIAEGTFANAVHLNIENFSDFPQAVTSLPEAYKSKILVTFCTGGIRCEKASAYLLRQGFKEVYQLQGGIINYFKQCAGAYFQGECFVFDERITLNEKLEEKEDMQNPVLHTGYEEG